MGFLPESRTVGITIVENYSALPNAVDVVNKTYFVKSSQGTKWLPFSWGGTYYGSGIYYSDGTKWSTLETPYFSTQADTNSGLITDQFVSPATLNNYSGWNAGKVGLNFVDEEVPYGIIDSVNNIFTTQFMPKTGSLQVFLNGIRLKNTNDFTYTGDVITMINIPYLNDKLIINYRY